LITITSKRRKAFSVAGLCEPESLGEHVAAKRPAERLGNFLGALFHFRGRSGRARDRSAYCQGEIVKVDLPGVGVAPDGLDA